MNWIPESIVCRPDPLCGAEVVQLTSQPVISSNIYCEQRYASVDGSRIAISRHPFGHPAEIWVCDLNTLRVGRIGEGKAIGANPARNAVYFIATGPDGDRLMRLDLARLETICLHAFGQQPAPRVAAVSPGEDWFVGGPCPVAENRYSLQKVDLASGLVQTLCEIEDIVNPHLQFDPSRDGRLLVQINRGAGAWTPSNAEKRVGTLGATLGVVEVETGILELLPVGRPLTPLISGHECWAGTSGRLVFTTVPNATESQIHESGVYSMTPGDVAAHTVVSGQPFNHIAASDDGRFFIADDYYSQRIFVGSLEGGTCRALCDSHTRQGAPQYSHAHPYLTPDNRHVVFNSNQSGIPQVYAASVPPDFLQSLAPDTP